MSRRYYVLCRRNLGKQTQVLTREGRRYAGVITKVTTDSVYLSPHGKSIKENKHNSLAKKIKTAVGTNNTEKGKKIFFFPLIIPLAAIAGLTIIGSAPFYAGYPPDGFPPFSFSGFRNGPYRYGVFRRRGF